MTDQIVHITERLTADKLAAVDAASAVGTARSRSEFVASTLRHTLKAHE